VLEDAVGHVRFVNIDVRAAHRQLQARVGLAQLLLQPLALRNILDDRDEITGSARRFPLERDEQLHPDERAVLAEVTFLQRQAGRLAPQRRRRHVDARCQVVGVRDVMPGLFKQLLARVADDGAELLVDAQEPALGVRVGDADRGVLERAAEPLLALAQRLLGPLAVGGFGWAAHETNRLPPGVAHGNAPCERPAVGTVLVAAPAFDLVLTGLPGQVAANGLFHPCAILWVDLGHAGLVGKCGIGWGFVAVLLPDIHEVHPRVTVVAVGHVIIPDADVRAAQRQLGARGGLAQLLLQSFAFGDVLQDRDDGGGRPRRVAPERDGLVDPDRRTILADEALLQRVTGLLAPQEWEELLEAGGQIIGVRDVLPGLLEQLLAGVADELAAPPVAAQEAALEIPVGDAAPRVLERAAEPLLALPQGILRSSAIQQDGHLVRGDGQQEAVDLAGEVRSRRTGDQDAPTGLD